MERRVSLVARLVGRHPAVAGWLLTGVVTLVALEQRLGVSEHGAGRARAMALGNERSIRASVRVMPCRGSPGA